MAEQMHMLVTWLHLAVVCDLELVEACFFCAADGCEMVLAGCL